MINTNGGEKLKAEKNIGNLGILSLILSKGITNLPSLIVALLLVDISTTFNIPVGVAGQIRTTSGLLSIAFALIMGVLSIKYNHKTLLQIGLILYIVSAVGSYYSTSFTSLLAIYSLVGVATAMVNPMINAIIGTYVDPEKSTTVIGWTVAGLSLIYLAGSLSAGYISQWSWRTAFLLVIVPITVVTCLMCRNCIPRVQTSNKDSASGVGFLSGYNELLGNRSALGCILGTVLGLATWNLYLIYGASYWRQAFQISVATISVSLIFTSLSYTAGSLVSSKIIKRFGIKRILIFSTGVLGFFTLFVFNAPSFLVSFGLTLFASLSAGVMITASSGFALMQIPEYQGTMMSLHSAAYSTGATISAALGGYLLLLYGFGRFSLVMGFLGLAGALVLQALTVNPVSSGEVKK